MHRAARAADAAALVVIEVRVPTIVGQFAQFRFELRRVNPEADHGAKVHVAADSGRAIIDESGHLFTMLKVV